MRKIKLTENQLKYLIENENVTELTIDKIAKDLMSSFSCGKSSHDGGDFKDLVRQKLVDYGFREVIVKFLKRDDVKNLYYLIYTEDLIFKIVVSSDIFEDAPCLSIIEVESYSK
jgi:hypothetical protein